MAQRVLLWIMYGVLGTVILAFGAFLTSPFWWPEKEFPIGVVEKTEGYIMSVTETIGITDMVVFNVAVFKNNVGTYHADAFAARSHGLKVGDRVIIARPARNEKTTGYRYQESIYETWIARPKPK